MMQNTAKIGDRLRSNAKMLEPRQAAWPSRTLREILVPHDLSNEYREVLNYAIQLAKTFGSTLHLLHIYQEPYVLDSGPRGRICDVFKPQRQQALAKFYYLLEKTREELPKSRRAF